MLLLATVGSGLMCGLFYSFSDFIMKAFSRLPTANGIASMQSINLVIVKRSFLGVFFGTGVLVVLALVIGWNNMGDFARIFSIVGAMVYIIGCLGVTIAFNVPLNNRLAVVDPNSEEGEQVWNIYLVEWVKWNHVRSISTLLSTLALMMGLYSAN